MEEHRVIDADEVTTQTFDPPFSAFEHVDRHYGEDNPAIRRLFSLARSHAARTLMTERIRPTGMISDENEEIRKYVPDHEMKGLQRVSF